jgi:hypothetical protein
MSRTLALLAAASFLQDQALASDNQLVMVQYQRQTLTIPPKWSKSQSGIKFVACSRRVQENYLV